MANEKKMYLHFNEQEQYDMAKDFYSGDGASAFFADEQIDEMRTLVFYEYGDMDRLEMDMTEELEENGFESYWFESE